MKPQTAKQINDPQCGEAWTAYMVGGSTGAEQVLESLFKAVGAKMVQVCSECCQPFGGEAWSVAGKDGRYCTKCAYDLAREHNDTRRKKKRKSK